MCGIVGIIGKKNFCFDDFDHKLKSSLSSIKHRGPDDSDVFIEKNIGFGHVRLSIIDLSNNGRQPMLSQNGDCLITYNGEVYNFNELKDELPIENHNFKSKTDTEIILEQYLHFGVSTFEKLNGMFAFALFDRKNQSVFLVRDRLGIKPLFYFQSDDFLIFSSEIKALKFFVNLNEIEYSSLPEWSYYGNSLSNRTLYKGVSQLLPGHYIKVDLDNFCFEQKKYWSPSQIKFTKSAKGLDAGQIIKQTKKLLDESVERQLVGDVPIGIFLSGGIDSSAITAIASNYYDKKIDTFSVGFDYELGEGELGKAAYIAKLFDTNHHSLRVTGYDIADTVQELVRYHDSPFSDAANIPLFLLGQKVKDKTKVVLQGDGGDELFAGYKRYTTLSHINKWRTFAGILSPIHKLLFPKTKSYFSRQRYLNALNSKSDAELMALLLTVEDKERSPIELFSEEFIEKMSHINPFDAYQQCEGKFVDMDIVQRMLITDTQIILPNIFLEKVDRATMAASIEVRVPFLDNHLVEYVMSLPSSIKARGGENKWLLKKALEGTLPKEILYTRKTGFGVPYQLWLKGPLKELFNDKASELRRKKIKLLNWKYLDYLLEENTSNRRENSFLLWKALNFMIWLSQNEQFEQ